MARKKREPTTLERIFGIVLIVAGFYSLLGYFSILEVPLLDDKQVFKIFLLVFSLFAILAGLLLIGILKPCRVLQTLRPQEHS